NRLAWVFHAPIENSTVRRLRARGRQSSNHSPCRPRVVTRRATWERFGLGLLFRPRTVRAALLLAAFLLPAVPQAHAFSLNHPPTAFNDSYTVAEDNVLSVTAPGVLGNDT